MPQTIFYASPEIRLDWTNWKVGPPPDGLHLSHIQEVSNDPADLLGQFYDGLAATEACGRVLQYSRRIAIDASLETALHCSAETTGLEARLSQADIKGSNMAVRLGYLQLAGRPNYPELSALERGLRAGHCLLVRTAAIVSTSINLPINVRHLAGLDVLHRHAEVLPDSSARYGRTNVIK